MGARSGVVTCALRQPSFAPCSIRGSDLPAWATAGSFCQAATKMPEPVTVRSLQ